MKSSGEKIVSRKIRNYLKPSKAICMLINRLLICFGQESGSPRYFVFKRGFYGAFLSDLGTKYLQ